MKRNPFTRSTYGIGPGPSDIAQARIRAMATLARLTKQTDNLLKEEDEQSNRERARKMGLVYRDPILDALPEIKSWNPATNSTRRLTSESPSGEANDKGQSVSDKSMPEGSFKAKLNQTRKAIQVAISKIRN